MSASDIFQLILTLAPAIIVGVGAYYFFNNYLRNEENRRGYELRKENQKETIPYRIQALERMTLYLERIDPGRLLVRVKPNGDDKHDYEKKLIKTIEDEFEHNLAQQIYMSTACWDAIRSTKNATITLIRKANMDDQVDSANKLREVVLSELLDKSAPSATGLAYIKKEAREIW